MLTVLSNIWKLIVKALTFGTIKGNAYLDSKITPLEKLDDAVKRANEAADKQRHEYFKMLKGFKQSKSNLEKSQEELEKLEDEIREIVASGDEVRASQKGRIAVAKIKFIETLKDAVEKSEKRILDMEYNIEKLKADVQILETKRSELEMVSSQRDYSKNKALGEVTHDGVSTSIDALIKNVTADIDNAFVEDDAWKDTDSAFNGDDNSTLQDEVGTYLNKFKQ